MPAYLYTLAALSLIFAVLECWLILIMEGLSICYHGCCASERRIDMQVLRLEAHRNLRYELCQRIEQEGLYKHVDLYNTENAFDEEIQDFQLLKFSKKDGHYIYSAEAVDELHR